MRDFCIVFIIALLVLLLHLSQNSQPKQDLTEKEKVELKEKSSNSVENTLMYAQVIFALLSAFLFLNLISSYWHGFNTRASFIVLLFALIILLILVTRKFTGMEKYLIDLNLQAL